MNKLSSVLDRVRSRLGAFCHDLLMIPVAWLGAYWLRYNLETVPAEMLAAGLAVLPGVVVVQGATFWYFGLYRGVWRFASLPDLLRILKAVLIGVVLCALAVFFLTRMNGVPRSVIPLYALLLLMLLGAPRLIYRRLKERRFFPSSRQQVAIVGAGRAGELLVRDLRLDPELEYEPVAFFDDDPEQRGREIHGLRVVGSCDHIPRLANELDIDLLLLAVPSASAAQMRRLVANCEESGVPFRTLPPLADLVSGRAALGEMREVGIEDLLGRDPVQLDWDAIRLELRGRVVLVTGGAGSIGSELCRQIAQLSPDHIVIVDQSEHSLYLIEKEFAQKFPDVRIDARLVDVADQPAVTALIRRYEPEIVFHAAAYKHVPLLEAQSREAIKTNVLGTQYVAEAAVAVGCKTFVLISTDKAVHPANVMGATKRLAELVCQRLSLGCDATEFVTVRFGNVLDSAGSVVPLFREQIANGGPVTVTDKRMTRFFMTIPEACQLILQAGAIGRGGSVFVLDMGEPVSILYLAEQMIRLAGKRPGQDIEIVTTRVRPGEKLTEQLFHSDERFIETAHKKLFLARTMELDIERFDGVFSMLEAACIACHESALLESLRRLVPDYTDGDETTSESVESATVIPLDRAHKRG
ncbi:MAG: polysaccharide biosynthesis protein [Gammaproteobacteria bacterium]|nr:polysaccharide biosynthesis protein [Gammaproteobacteria bacterium]